LQGTQNSILQKLQHQAIKEQFTTSLAESAAIANQFFRSHLQSPEVPQELKKSGQDDLFEIASRKVNVNTNSSFAASKMAGNQKNREFLDYIYPVCEKASDRTTSRLAAQLDSHQNARRQYFDEEAKHVSQSMGVGNSASSIRSNSNHTKVHDQSIISINQLNSNIMPDRRILKRQGSQAVSDDGVEKLTNPYCMTGQFDNKGFEFENCSEEEEK
jgi:hypothetical protein